MKQIITLLFLILFVCSGCTHKFDGFECDESGVCGEGIEYTINHDTFIINKQTCLEHGKEWNDKLNVCYMY